MNMPFAMYVFQIVRDEGPNKGEVLFSAESSGEESLEESNDLTDRYELAAEALRGIGVPCSFQVSIIGRTRRPELAEGRDTVDADRG